MAEAWAEERALLSPIPQRLLQRSRGTRTSLAEVIDLSAIKAQGALVEHRSLEVYGKVTP